MTANTTSPTPAPARSTTLRTVLLIGGAVVLVIVILSVIVRVAVASTHTDASATYEVTESFDSIRLSGSAVDVNVFYRDVADTQLDFHQGDTNLTIDHSIDGEVLRVTVDNGGWNWLDWGNWGWWDEEAYLNVVLPDELEGMSLALDTSAGDVDIEGAFGDLTLGLTAGDVELAGSADELSISSTAGNVTVSEYSLRGSLRGESTAGDVSYEFVTLPESITVSSAAGDVDVELPAGEYRIETNTTAGEVDQNVSSDAGSDRVYRIQTTAGDISISER